MQQLYLKSFTTYAGQCHLIISLSGSTSGEAFCTGSRFQWKDFTTAFAIITSYSVILEKQDRSYRRSMNLANNWI